MEKKKSRNREGESKRIKKEQNGEEKENKTVITLNLLEASPIGKAVRFLFSVGVFFFFLFFFEFQVHPLSSKIY